MKTYIINFRCYDGSEGYEIVRASSEHAAIMAFENFGIVEILFIAELENEEDEDEI